MYRRILCSLFVCASLSGCSTDQLPFSDVGVDMSVSQADAARTDTADDEMPATDTGTPDAGSPGSDFGGTDGGAAPDPDTGGSVDMAEADMGACPDRYEPNDVVGDAPTVTSGTTIRAANCGFDDDDIFAIELTAGDRITLVHTFTNNDGNLDLNLHAPSQRGNVSKTGSYAAATFGFGSEETLMHTAAETGTYYILSFNNNDTDVPYELAITVQR